jgi:phosphatidylglycerophosphatase A
MNDQINPAAIHASAVVEPRVAKDYLALVIATCGVGYFPIAPGTWGSLVGVGIYLAERYLGMTFLLTISPGGQPVNTTLPFLLAIGLILITVITLAGFWASSRSEKLLGKKDPGKVVIDEVAGQLIAMLPLGFSVFPGLSGIIISFLLFRLFDIIKPYPARRLEKLESGLGIMIDDLVAGAYAAVATSVIIIFYGILFS